MYIILINQKPICTLLIFFFNYRALLYGGLKESHQSEVEISEASVNSFKKLLEYIYSGRMNLSILKVKLTSLVTFSLY